MTTGATDRTETTGRGTSVFGAALLVLEVLVAYALVALVAGLIWEAVWAPPDQVVQQHQVYPADYEALRRFIYDVESAPEFLIIDHVSLSQNEPGKPLTLGIEFSTYYRLGANGA